MSTITEKPNTQMIEGYIRNGIEKEVAASFDEIKKQFIEDLDRRKDEICAGILIHVMKQVEITRMQENIIVTIREIK